MPIYDRRCPSCERVSRDHYEPITPPVVSCVACGVATERAWLGRSAHVHGDDKYIGGMTFENLGHEPVTVYSESEKRRIMNERGLREFVRHAPEQGSDKSKHTGRWV